MQGVEAFKLGQQYVNQSVSTGSLHPRDLIQNLEQFITWSIPHKQQELVIPIDIHFELDAKHLRSEEWYLSGEARSYLDDLLWPFLESLAPEGCTFGAHFGDGADFGFWQEEE